jgi:hypothetical protein
MNLAAGIVSAAGVALVLASASTARAERLGVLIVPAFARDGQLADNLSEVAMARIAETPGHVLAGNAELRRRLGAEGGRTAVACMGQPACLGNLAVSLGVSRLLTGVIRTEAHRFLLNLSITDVAAGRVESRFFRQVNDGLPRLVRAVQDGVDQMLQPRPAPGHLRVQSQPDGARVTVDNIYVGTTPFRSADLLPGPHSVRVDAEGHFPWKSAIEMAPGQDLDLNLGQSQLLRRRTWAPYLAYGSAGAAVVCTSMGGVLGTLARVTPSGDTRQEAQMDLDRRHTYGYVGTTLLLGGAVLATVSALVFWTRWRDIAGDRAR